VVKNIIITIKMQNFKMKKIVTAFLCLALSLTAFLACKKDNTGGTPVVTKANPTKITLNPQTTFQTISGFGGANRMWGTQSLKPAEATKAFGLNDGELGLSIFRVRLSSNKNEWSIITEAVKEANKNGVKVLASPWSPPPALKDNNSDIRGILLPQNYTAFKNYINEFIAYQAQNGAKIDVISIQNEPDWKPTYESCDWTADEMIKFLNAPGQIVGAKLAAPESLNFNPTMTNAILSNDSAATKIDIVAGHIYGGGLAKFPLAEQKKKEIWMTEFLLNLNTGTTGAAAWNTYSSAAIWAESVKMLNSVHDAMSNNWNAYIWWYLQRFYSFIGDGEEGTTNGAVLKRGYAFSHFSKFVRPGFIRIGVDVPALSFLKITAYKKDAQTVIVILNPETFAVKNIQLNGLTPKSVVAYSTNATATMAKTTPTITNNVVDIDMEPLSVTTLVINN
jgi:glucuronoarabinoxylan endo-1,4-beta-xylanase